MANDVYELEIIYNIAGEQAANVIHLQSGSSTPTTTPGQDADQLLADFQSIEEADIQALVAGDCFIAGYRCRRLNNGGGNTAVLVSGVPGTFGGDSTAGQVCALSVLGYNPGGHYRAGRIFWPTTGASAIVDNIIDMTIITAIQNIVSSLVAGISSSSRTYKLVVWSRKHVQAYQVVFDDISLLIGTIRKRLKPVM
jgi:hypothetical protein